MRPIHILLIALLGFCTPQPEAFLPSKASEGSYSNQHASYPRMKWFVHSAGLELPPVDLSASSAKLMEQSGPSDSVVPVLEPIDLSVPSTSSNEQHPNIQNPVQQQSPLDNASCAKVEFSSITSEKNSEMPSKKFKCSACCKILASSNSLKFHCARFHGDGSLYECVTCNKKFARRSDVRTHMRIHTNERPFSCQHCNRSFSQSISLKQHLRIHSGERPFECNVCHSKFNRLDNYRRHYQAKHSGTKPFAL